MMQNNGFIRVSHDRCCFEQADGTPFFFVGANCYYLLTRSADPGLRQQCTCVLDDAAAAGITVLRLWAFADGPQWNALQPSPGVFEERVFRGLDWLVTEAAARGLRLLLVLTNYWKDYGGMRQYVAWACAQRGEEPPSAEGAAAEPFYTDAACQSMFRGAVAATVQRVNSLTGVPYRRGSCRRRSWGKAFMLPQSCFCHRRDNATILGWALANEPRCAGDTSCATIPRWAHHTAAFLKALDPNHLVTVDCEGFLGASTPDACRHNPHNCSGSGCDFAGECGSPAIDFASCHSYPDLWLPQADEQARLCPTAALRMLGAAHTWAAGNLERLRFALSWLECHVALSRRLRKPLVLSEFGKRREEGGREESRAYFFQEVLQAALRHMTARAGLAGTEFWMIAAPSYPDHDGFTVYFSGTQSCATNGTADAIRQHAVAVARLNNRPDQPNPLLADSCTQPHAEVGAGGGGDQPSEACPCCVSM
ncbi:Mannan endo-1 [Chlorella vulgaris]